MSEKLTKRTIIALQNDKGDTIGEVMYDGKTIRLSHYGETAVYVEDQNGKEILTVDDPLFFSKAELIAAVKLLDKDVTSRLALQKVNAEASLAQRALAEGYKPL